MIVRKIISRTLYFAICGVAIITVSCLNELFNGTGLTHPVWDASYNWLPLIGVIMAVSLGGSIVSALSSYRYSLNLRRNTYKADEYQPGY